MKSFQVEIDGSTKTMGFSELGNLLAPLPMDGLIAKLKNAYSVPIDLTNGKKAIVRQLELLTDLKPETIMPAYEVTLATSIPVSIRVFVYAKNEVDAEKTVKRMLSENRIKKHQIPNIKNELEEELHHWLQEVECDDWVIGDAELVTDETIP